MAATAGTTHIDCACHRLNTSIDTAWKKVVSQNCDLERLNTDCHELVRFANQASGIQSNLPKSLKHGGETRPWRSLTDMFSSILDSREALIPMLRDRKKEQLIARIDVDLLKDVVSFMSIFPSLFDILEYANIPTLQNSLPVYYTLHEAWQPHHLDSEAIGLMKKEFLAALTDKYWSSLTMLHFVATYLDPTLRGFVFVKKQVDRQGFLNQVRDALRTMAIEPALSPVSSSASSIVTEMPSTSSGEAIAEPGPQHKKLKVDPFSWCRSSVQRYYTCIPYCYEGLFLIISPYSNVNPFGVKNGWHCPHTLRRKLKSPQTM